jgi:hypothetical protein
MAAGGIESELQAVTDALVSELLAITPASMAEVQFEIVGTPDGGADIGLLENHPDAVTVALSDAVYDHAGRYLPLVRRYIRGWRRSLLTLRESEGNWQASMAFERE